MEFYDFPYIGNNPSQLTFIFFRGVETTNQNMLMLTTPWVILNDIDMESSQRTGFCHILAIFHEWRLFLSLSQLRTGTIYPYISPNRINILLIPSKSLGKLVVAENSGGTRDDYSGIVVIEWELPMENGTAKKHCLGYSGYIMETHQ